MDKYLIIADDFTGANDTGVQMCRRGIRTQVFFAAGAATDGETSLVIDTESRAVSPERAAEAVRMAASALDLESFKYVIKKVDSTLRGNIAAEVRALDEVYVPELVIFAPALPDLGRTTVGGVHRLKGVPITQTELAHDPKTPVNCDDLRAILCEVYEEPVRHIPLEQVSAGSIDLSDGRIFSFDAMTNGDMQKLISAAREKSSRILWVGAAAVADNLFELEKKTLPALAVSGSVSNVTRTQLHYAVEKGASLVKVSVYELLRGEETPEAYVRAAVEQLAAGRDTLLVASSSYDRADMEKADALGAQMGYSQEKLGAYIQELMGDLTLRVLSQTQVSGVFLTGGDTARGFFARADAAGSEILSEILVGIPMIRILGGPCEGLRVVTKAGAFGGEDAVAFALRKLKES